MLFVAQKGSDYVTMTSSPLFQLLNPTKTEFVTFANMVYKRGPGC